MRQGEDSPPRPPDPRHGNLVPSCPALIMKYRSSPLDHRTGGSYAPFAWRRCARSRPRIPPRTRRPVLGRMTSGDDDWLTIAGCNCLPECRDTRSASLAAIWAPTRETTALPWCSGCSSRVSIEVGVSGGTADVVDRSPVGVPAHLHDPARGDRDSGPSTQVVRVDGLSGRRQDRGRYRGRWSALRRVDHGASRSLSAWQSESSKVPSSLVLFLMTPRDG